MWIGRRARLGWSRYGACALALVAPACEESGNPPPCLYDGPWTPVNAGERCDAPEGVYVNALDACGYYECKGSHWFQPDDGVCESIIPSPLATESCSTQCLTDLVPETIALDPGCSYVSESMDGAVAFLVARCDLVDDAWVIPAGEPACIGITVLGGAGVRALPDACSQVGVNAGFVIVGDLEAARPPGHIIRTTCAFQPYPLDPCPPNAFLPEDPETAACANE